MLDAIRDFFEKHVGTSTRPGAERHSIEVATAALLVEVVRMDGDIDPAEREAVLRAVHASFGLSGAEADELIRLAEQEARQAADLYQFTSLLNRSFSAEQKVSVIEHLWRVAFADAELSAWEQHLVRKVADLLYVPHSAYIAAKVRARAAAGLPPATGDGVTT
ncbi:MAG: TerB family tellurite resistance protein [Burkholderiales bacterium]|nr:TerB family tellurite resistance protein [Burkholderiales bacterium]